MTAMTTAAEGRATLAQRAPRRPETSVWPRRAVVTLALAVPALAVVAVVLHLDNGATPLTEWWYGSLVLALTLLLPALLIARNRPANPLGWLLGAACLLEAVCSAGREYLIYGLLGGTAPGWLWIGWFADSCYLVAIVTLPIALMLFPDGRVRTRWQRVALAVPMVGLAFSWFGYLFTGDVAHIRGHALANPGAALLPQQLTSTALMIGQPLLLLSLLLAVVALFVRLRRARGVEREQLKWVVWAGSISAVELVTEFIPGNGAAVYLSMVTDALLVGAFAVAILRHRLLDIDVVINRTLVFATLSVLVVGGYLAIVVRPGPRWSASRCTPGSGLAAAALVAVGFAPAALARAARRRPAGLRRTQEPLPRRHPARPQPRVAAGPGGELDVVVTTLVQTLRLPHAAIVDPDGTPLASHRHAGRAVAERRLTYQGSPVGSLLVSPRSGSGGFSRGRAAAAGRPRPADRRGRARRPAVGGAAGLAAAAGLGQGGGAPAAAPRPARRARPHPGRGRSEAGRRRARWSRDARTRPRRCSPRSATTSTTPSTTSAGWCTSCARPPSTSSAWSAALRESVRGFGTGPAGPAITVRRPPTAAATVDAAGRRRGRRLPHRHRGDHQRGAARRAPPAARSSWTCDDALRIVVRDDGVGGCASWRCRGGHAVDDRAGRRARRLADGATAPPDGRGTEIRVHLPLR